MGLHALPTTGLELERVEVGQDALLGGTEGADVQAILNASRIGLGAVMLGMSRAVLEFCVPYTKDRVAFDEPISKKQSIAFRLSEMHIEQHALRQLVWQGASLLDHGEDDEGGLARAFVRRRACGSPTTASRSSEATASSASTPSRCGSATRAPSV